MAAKAKGFNPAGRTEISRLRKSLDDLFDRVATVDPEGEIAGDLNRYLCIRVSGFVEQSLLSLGRAAVERLSGNIATAFSLSWLERAPNPTAREIERLVGRFNPLWQAELGDYLAEEERRSRLNALVGIRNDVSHGKNQGVSRRQAQEYFALAIDVVTWIADHLEPPIGKL